MQNRQVEYKMDGRMFKARQNVKEMVKCFKDK